MILTEQGTRIDLPLIDCKHRRNIELSEYYLLLHITHLEYKIRAAYESDDRTDADGIWTDVKTNYRWTRLRSDMSQVDMYFDNPQNLWMVSIEFRGVADPTGWFFDDPKKAVVVYNKLKDYMISK